MIGNKTLILGLGNEILTDDSIGIRLVKDLKLITNYAETEYATASCGGFEIIEYILGFEKVIFIDAIRTGKEIPGSIFFFRPSDFIETLHLSNLHDISFLTALKLGKELKMNLPSEIDIIAIEILEDRVFSNNLSPVIEGKYSAILSDIKEYINTLLSGY